MITYNDALLEPMSQRTWLITCLRILSYSTFEGAPFMPGLIHAVVSLFKFVQERTEEVSWN